MDAAYNMKFSIGTNFDDRLIDAIREIDTARSIKSVFGKLRKDITGGGRASMILPKLTMKGLARYIDYCHKNGLKFNYLLNPMCLGNKEINARSHLKILNYIERLLDAGADQLTLNSPYLCELVKKQFPRTKVTIGLYAYIYNLQHVKYWEGLGADELTLHHLVNRNFALLEECLKYCKNKDMELRLIANNVCLHDCPYQINHGTGQSHASQKGNFSSDLYLDYNLLSCNYSKIKDPAKLLASEWIRPEDIHVYEELARKTGNSRFSIKLLERTKTTDFLIKVICAYTSRSYDGNLIDILTWPSKKNALVIHKLPMYIKAVLGGYNLVELRKFESTFNLPPIRIDNKSLNGFIEKFKVNYDCNANVCGEISRREEPNGYPKCSYCSTWAENAVTYDEPARAQWLAEADSVFDALKTSRIFGKGK